jgi:cell division protein FtsW
MSRKLTYDTWLFGAAMLIVVIGLVMIYSASAIIATQKFGAGGAYFFLTKQCVALIVGGALMLVLMHLDPAILADRRLIYLALALVAIALITALFQSPINGTRRWLVLPRFQVQPSEFAKPLVVLFLASFLARKEERIDELTTTLLPLACVLALFAGLIYLEPDFGTATTLLVVAGGMIFTAGLSWKRLAVLSIGLVPIAIALALGAAYRRDRLLVFLNPESDPQGKGFQAMQSLIALGTGGLRGLGIGNGRQKLFFLPEPHTDFIFSIIGEELGFAGAVILIALFGFLVWRGFRVAMRSEERFAFYAALGLTLIIAVQALINVSVALCLLPTKGLPLPLVSYGGSSLIASLMAVGILLNLSQRAS